MTLPILLTCIILGTLLALPIIRTLRALRTHV